MAKRSLWRLALLLAAGPCAALPVDFGDKVTAALLCRSEWSTDFWHGYFSLHLQKSLRDWGEARWWDGQGAQLGGVTAKEVFTNLPESQALMVGILIEQPVEEVRRIVEQNLLVTFHPVLTVDGTRYMNDSASVMVGLTNQQTKWYCARWNLGNRP
ncbi:hypothetical protein [Chitinimonas lacunae]|uniref:Uncharacterized protein n=1 Tax=Chitinimonas lacunae TaxID=1963018 RepID=A0ABV8MU23_9NEIS